MSEATVLVLERDPLRQEQLRAMFEAAGYRTMLVHDGAEAAQAVAGGAFRLVLLDPGLPDVDLAALRAALAPRLPAAPLSLEEAERRHIADMLRYTGGNRRQAALQLGVARSTLLAKIRRYGLESVR